MTNRQKLLQKIKHLTEREQKKILNQCIDLAVEMYQNNNNNNNFDLIVDLYEPKKYIKYWFNKYGNLADSNYEDFESEYMFCFVKACNKYRENKKTDNDSFNSYFFSILSNHFINEMGRRSCNKRNPSVLCPLCGKDVAPLNIHILKEHQDFILKILNNNENDFKCKFCGSLFDNNLDLCKHVASKHSSIVFDFFKKEFPNYNITIKDPSPPIGLIRTNDDFDLMDNEKTKPIDYIDDKFENKISINNITPCQQAIIKSFEFFNISKIPSYKKICERCKEINKKSYCVRGDDFVLTKKIYENEIADLGNKIRG